MKRFWILILASFVLLTPTGCARFPRRQLEDIESYLESRPDSALTALDAMSRRKLYTPALRAHHALLFSMALDKNYIDIADDSIARVAVDWYRFHKPLNHRMKAWYYLGRVQHHAGYFASASLAYEEALQYASQLKDNHYLGIINYSSASLWLSSFDGNHALSFNEAAIRAFSEEGHQQFEVYSRIQKGEILYSLMRFDESWAVFDSLLSQSGLTNSSRASCLRGQAGILSQKAEHPEQVPLLYRQAQQLSSWPLSSRDYGNLALAFARLHQMDSTIVFREKARQSIQSGQDSSSFTYLESRLSLLSRNYKMAYECLEQAVSGQTQTVYKQLNQSLAFAQKEHFQESLREKNLAMQNLRYRYVIVILGLIVLFGSAILFLIRTVKRRKEETTRAEELLMSLSDVKDELLLQQNKMQSLVASRLGFVQQLYGMQLQLFDDHSELDSKQKAQVVNQFKQDLRNLKNDQRLIDDIADLLDTTHDHIISDLKRDTKGKLKQQDITILTLFFAQIPYTTISFITDITATTLRTRKYRYRHFFETLASKRAMEYQKMLT